MPDAFEALRRPLVPLAPDLGFAARLRARLEHALTEGEPVTPQPQALTPYLAVSPARDAIAWYVDVFDATLLGDPIVMPDDRIGHAALRIGTAQLFLSDAHPEIGVDAPAPDAGTAVSLHVTVRDVDRLVALAASQGAVVDREPSDNPYGRVGVIRDPFGHRWMLNGPVRPPAKQGDLVHYSLQMPDGPRAAAFYAAVLGWELEVDENGYAARARGQSVSSGIWGGEPSPGVTPPGVHLVWTVDDIEAAGAAVRAAGGTTGQLDTRPYGLILNCVDNQGLGFSLHQDLPGPTPTPSPEPMRQGDLEYVTIGAPDENAAAAFYAAVLGWRTEPGHVPHGLQLVGPTPPGGLWGGDPGRQRVQLMFRVDDVVAAAERVRAAGGSAGAVEQMPYGRSVDCADDQGLRFWLLQP